MAGGHQLCLPHCWVLPPPGRLQEDDLLPSHQPAAAASSNDQGRYVSTSAICAPTTQGCLPGWDPQAGIFPLLSRAAASSSSPSIYPSSSFSFPSTSTMAGLRLSQTEGTGGRVSATVHSRGVLPGRPRRRKQKQRPSVKWP